MIYYNGNYFVIVGLVSILQMSHLFSPLTPRLYNPLYAVAIILIAAIWMWEMKNSPHL